MQKFQEAFYGERHQYSDPHHKHLSLSASLKGLLETCLADIDRAGLPPVVLEVGGGHGGYTEVALAAGCSVTVTEMSQPSLDHLRRRFGRNPNFSGVFDRDGSMADIVGTKYSMVFCSSVLHHIPDYLTFISSVVDMILPGGTFLSIQDPLWYPRMSRTSHWADRGAYFAWRATQGQYGRGLATRIRRARRQIDLTNPWDMIEYHVVRQGVDEEAISDLLRKHFASVEIVPYWSTQSTLLQATGDWLGWPNSTFAIKATDRH
jgi:SAM-dependent methyltransferase